MDKKVKAAIDRLSLAALFMGAMGEPVDAAPEAREKQRKEYEEAYMALVLLIGKKG